ncbi:hypothetical protein DDZ13_01985 [Coraliomargarita sinensis]|uniref:CcoQ/FixQ family Cbb3-type cytochrome c oxidase assembly chaperone n=1 Tax=Coraliomargarita sinensis TaxID=2174842 RepID=A0A317ZJA1_9BACT|nr:hypothetical protein [Coraliomargarita sinensis]PXA05666.1 hypothetical protein DDZ13_01985 [Coraliomargarita sinensis]
MFKRIIYDDWTTFVPLISFWFTFGVFLAISLRAFLLKKSTVQHMENLPLEEDASSNPSKHDS